MLSEVIPALFRLCHVRQLRKFQGLLGQDKACYSMLAKVRTC